LFKSALSSTGYEVHGELSQATSLGVAPYAPLFIRTLIRRC